MFKRMKSKLLLASMALLLLLAAGCQTIGNVDLSKAAVQLASVKSMEGNLLLTMELVPDPKADLSEESAAMIEAFRNLKLAIHDLRMQDMNHISMKGEFVFGRGSIPLHISLVNNDLAIQLEGAKKPVVFKISLESLGISLGPLPLTDEIQSKLFETLPGLSEKLIPFLFGKAKEPQKISVSPVTETIHNEKLDLNKVLIEMDGHNLQSWLTSLLTAVLADEAGMKELIGYLYDLLGPDLIQKAGQGNSLISSLLGNREFVVDIFTPIVQDLLTNVLVNMDDDTADGKEPGWVDAISLARMNLYLDKDLQTRKLTADVVMAGLAGMKGVQSIKISLSHERWNINSKSVKADLFDFKGGFIYSKEIHPRELLDNFDDQSLIYKLLKEDLHITRKAIPLPVGELSDAKQGKMPFIDENNRTLAPARFVSEILGADIEWNGDLQQVTVTAPGTTIVLTIGSKVALVNGQKVEFDTAAVLVPPGFTYVPVRFIVETLGAQVEFDAKTRTVFVIVEE